jgi:cytochrome c
MSSFEWNKIIASVLTAAIVAMVTGILAGALVHPKELSKPVFVVAGVAAPAAGESTAAAAPAKLPPLKPLLAKADAKAGEATAHVCETCHTFTKGGPNRIGPNLWDITQETMGTVPNYQFSAAMEKHKGQKWTPDELNRWLFDPQAYIPGTKMTFPGLPQAQARANVIAYLESLK